MRINLFTVSFIIIFYWQSLNASTNEALYNKYCSHCHHVDRIGSNAPALLPKKLKKISDQKLISMIKDGFVQTTMPKFDFLSDSELLQIVKYIKSPLNRSLKWTKKDITNSRVIFDDKKKPLKIKNIEQITSVVERDGGYIWIMENDKILTKFPLLNVHGGIKYTMDGESIYIPTRDGWVERYSLKNGQRVFKTRVCINLRNITLSKDDKFVMATCLLPKQIVILDAKTMIPFKIKKLEGKISALYRLYSKDKAIFTYRDRAKIGVIDTKTFDIKYTDINESIEDFFIDPFDEYMIATTRGGKILRVYELSSLKPVFEYDIEGMPHLFSATYWYKDGNFYFATPHLNKPYITIWKMYDWEFIKKIQTKGSGYFVKTHPNTPYLWIDNSSDRLTLVDKNNYKIKTITPVKHKKYIHTEFSGDGKYAYLSIYEHNGSIEVLDTQTFKKLASYAANIPVGKYNFINKNRIFYPKLFGREIFEEKCWGCHHEKSSAFGPSFSKIANTRSESEIYSYILAPSHEYKSRGYKRNLMPPFKLNNHELKSIVDYIKKYKGKE